MPEGPEVKRIVDQMSAVVNGHTLTDVTVLSGRYIKKPIPNLDEFMATLPMTVTEVKCKGKFIYMLTDSDWNIWSTLGMTGSWMGSTEKLPEHVRVELSFYGCPNIYFGDMRNFGTLKFVKGKDELEKKLDSLGTDILVEDLPDDIFKARLINRGRKTLPEILMDQRVIAGIGNYIKAEALYLAKLSPHRTAGSLSDDEIRELNRAIHSVIRESYKSGGSTFRTYSDFNGDTGSFSSRFMVYRQDKDPLGNPVIKEDTKDKRTTHWVPKVQK